MEPDSVPPPARHACSFCRAAIGLLEVKIGPAAFPARGLWALSGFSRSGCDTKPKNRFFRVGGRHEKQQPATAIGSVAVGCGCSVDNQDVFIKPHGTASVQQKPARSRGNLRMGSVCGDCQRRAAGVLLLPRRLFNAPELSLAGPAATRGAYREWSRPCDIRAAERFTPIVSAPGRRWHVRGHGAGGGPRLRDWRAPRR